MILSIAASLQKEQQRRSGTRVPDFQHLFACFVAMFFLVFISHVSAKSLFYPFAQLPEKNQFYWVS